MLDKADRDDALILVVIRALGKLGSDAAIKAIIKPLQSGSVSVQQEAIQALSALINEPHAAVIATSVSEYTAGPVPAVR
jgi:HEAT repeat protein